MPANTASTWQEFMPTAERLQFSSILMLYPTFHLESYFRRSRSTFAPRNFTLA